MIFLVFAWYYAIVVGASVFAYALGTWMRIQEDREYCKQQERRAYLYALHHPWRIHDRDR